MTRANDGQHLFRADKGSRRTARCGSFGEAAADAQRIAQLSSPSRERLTAVRPMSLISG